MIKFRNDDNSAVLSNPGMGWVIHHAVHAAIKDPNEPDTYENLDNVALLSRWAELEPREGEFYWEELDRSIEKWTALGKKLQFRISTDAMIYSGSAAGAPDWLYERYDIPVQTRQDYNLLLRYPDYLNPVYLEKLQNFLNALAGRYGDHPGIETVDLRGYGEWGEWHSGYGYKNYAQRAAALRGIIDAWYQAFQGKKTLIISCSYEWRQDMEPVTHSPASMEEFMYWSAFDYALSKENISLRRDGIGGAVKMWDARLMNDFYWSGKPLPMICEYFGGYNQKLDTEGIRGYHVEDSIEEALMLHPNYMMLMWDSVEFCRKRPDLVEYGLKRMGYRLLPELVELPESVNTGEFFAIRHTWVNLGAGRFCSDALLTVRLVHSRTGESYETGERYEMEESIFQPKVLSEGQRKKFMSNFYTPEHASPGEYSVEFKLYDTLKRANVKLPLDGGGNGFYPVGRITVL